jgi:hypothetical protein
MTAPNELDDWPIQEFGPMCEDELENGNLILCKQTQACIRDTQQAFQTRKSLVGLNAYVAGWKQGAKWGLSEYDSQRTPLPRPPK